MKMTYAELRTKSRILCSLTGLTGQEFEALLPSFAAAWDAFIQETFQREGRKRAMGAGRKATLRELEDKLLFILVYFRLYPTQAVQGFLFEMSQAQANEWVHRLTRVLNQALGYERQLPEREPALVDKTTQTVQQNAEAIDKLTDDIGRFNECLDTCEQGMRWVVQLAFALLISATVALIINAAAFLVKLLLPS